MRRRLFVIEEIDGSTTFAPCESTVALTGGMFKIAGELMSSSIAQGGPSPSFLSPWVFEYLSKGIESINVHFARLHDSEFEEATKKVW